MMAKKLAITLTRSVIGRPQDQRVTVKTLGLKNCIKQLFITTIQPFEE